MNLFGMGWLELLFIMLLALIIFGPKQIGKIGESLRKFFLSGTYKSILQVRDDLKNLPQALAREANPELKEWKQDTAQLASRKDFGTWEGKQELTAHDPGEPSVGENSIAPPEPQESKNE